MLSIIITVCTFAMINVNCEFCTMIIECNAFILYSYTKTVPIFFRPVY